MEVLIEELVVKYGYFAVMFLILAENLFPPIPSEIILTMGGFLSAKLEMNMFLMVLAATAGSLIGAMILYKLGMVVSEERLRAFLKKYYKFFRVKEKDLDKTFSMMEKYGPYLVFFGRMIPVVRSLISIPAGMIRMDLKKFVLLTTMGTLIWNTVLISLGVRLGENWHLVVEVLENYSGVIKMLCVVAVLILVVIYIVRRLKEKRI